MTHDSNSDLQPESSRGFRGCGPVQAIGSSNLGGWVFVSQRRNPSTASCDVARTKESQLRVVRKIGAVILSPDRRRMIVVRKRGKRVFIIPGGRPEGAESDVETLRRELKEELSVELTSSSFLSEFRELAEFNEGDLIMRVYDVGVCGEPIVDNEIEEAIWIDMTYAERGIPVGSGLSRHVVPMLRNRGDLSP